MDNENRLVAALSYFIPLLGGVVVFFVRKDGFERFHAAQSILFWIAAVVVSVVLSVAERLLGIIPLLGKAFSAIFGLISLLFGLAVLILWLILMWKAYTGERFRLPLIGPEAAKLAGQRA
jgi:uncharacterized membrane protein